MGIGRNSAEFLPIPEFHEIRNRWELDGIPRNSHQFRNRWELDGIPTNSVSDTIAELVGGVPELVGGIPVLVGGIPELVNGIPELGWRDSGIGGTDSTGGTDSEMCNIAE